MNAAISKREIASERRVGKASRKIALFEKQFGPNHLLLLLQAAFPLALTPDLLYRLWANFQRDIHGQFLNIPWIAVSDILLSDLCREVGQELYEMDASVRNVLIRRLKKDPRFGQKRLQDLSTFLLEHVRKQLQSNDIDIRDLAQAQRWTILAYTQPSKAAHELGMVFKDLSLVPSPPKPELARMAALVETFSDPFTEAELEPLLLYARGIASWVRGNTQLAATLLEQVTDAGKIHIAGVNLPLLEAIENAAEPDQGSITKNYSGQNLRGRSFKGKNLRGANFSRADIRSADFTDADLMGANFTQATMGLQRRWASVLIGCSLLLSILAGFGTTIASFLGYIGLSEILSNLPLDEDNMPFFRAVVLGVLGFLALYITTLWRTLPTKWNAGVLSLLGSTLFLGIIPIYSLNSFGIRYIDVPAIFPVAFSGMAIISVLWLGRVYKGNAITLWVVLVGAITAIILTTILPIEKPENLVLSLSFVLIQTVVSLWLIWIGNQAATPTQKIVRVSMSGAVIGIITAIYSILRDFSYMTIVEIILPLLVLSILFSALAVISSIPSILAGNTNKKGATIATTIAAALVMIYFFMSFTPYSTFTPNTTWIYSLPLYIIPLLVGILAWASAIVIAIVMNLIWSEVNNRWIALAATLFSTVPFVVSGIVIASRALQWLPSMETKQEHFLLSLAGTSTITSLTLILGLYLGWRALLKDKKFVSIRELAISFAAQGGTNFQGANLTDTDFTEAILKSANFKDTTLTRASWFHAQKIGCTRITNSYLQSEKIQNLVVTGMGQNQNFDHLNLQGINLQQASLTEANFIGTNLIETNLQNTDLSRAKLIGTRLDKANLFGACLTGAYLEDVTITADTRLRGLECQYIFTKLPTKDSPDPGRVPADYSKIFSPGDLSRFMRQSFLH